VICWLLLGSAILNRLYTRPALTGPGGPGRTASMIAFVLGGYAVLMVLAQLRLSPVYSRLSLTLLTGFIAWIAARTTLLAVRGRLFPAS
jgi:hypothetical protein